MSGRDPESSPEPEGRTSPDAGPRRVHPTVQVDYPVRVVGHLSMAVVMASAFYERRTGLPLWTLMLGVALLWPHAAFVNARNSPNSRRTERVNLMLDGLIVGSWTAFLGFQLWPMVMMASAVAPAFLSVGGVRFAGLCGIPYALGILAVYRAVGPALQLESSPATTLLSILGILVYGSTFGLVTHRQARDILRFSKALAERNAENERQRQELAEALEHQTATAEILQAITQSAGSAEAALRAVAEHAARFVGSGDVVVMRLRAEALWAVAFHGTMAERPDPGRPLPVARDTVAGRAVLERRIVHVEDMAAASDDEWRTAKRYQRRMGYRTILAVPLLREGAAVGVMLFRRTEVEPFTARQIRTLQTFAQESAIALENARLFDELRARTQELARSLEEVRVLAEVSQAVSSSLELGEVLATVIRHAVTVAEADAGAIVRFRPESATFAVEASHGLRGEFVAALEAQRVDPGEGVLRRAAESSQPFQVDLEAAPGFLIRDVTLAEGFRTLLAAPVPAPTITRGVVLFRRRAGRFEERTVQLVVSLANQSKVAIEHAALFGETQRQRAELEHLSRSMERLYRLSTAMQEPLSLREQLHRVLQEAIQIGLLDRIYVWAVSPEANRLVNLAGAGFSDEETREFEGYEIPLDEAGAMGKAYREGRPLLFDDEHPVPPELRLRAPYSQMKAIRSRQLLIIPMIARGIAVGVLAGDNKPSGRPIARETVGLLQTFAAHGAVAIANARLFHTLEDKSRQLELASQAKSQFLANMSHELRTPLNAILGYTELILDDTYGPPPEKIRGVLERVHRSSKHLLGLINDVLDLSKIEAGQLTLAVSDYDMREVVQAAYLAAQPLAADKGLALDVDLPPALPPARGDERRLTQVLLNLVGNAVKFTDAGRVGLRVSVQGPHFLVVVSDTGPGIAAEDHERIFEEFHQVDGLPTRRKGGTGLGLAIARRIVELHGGRLWVESAPGHGSTFSFTVPVRLDRRRRRVPVQVERRRNSP